MLKIHRDIDEGVVTMATMYSAPICSVLQKCGHCIYYTVVGNDICLYNYFMNDKLYNHIYAQSATYEVQCRLSIKKVVLNNYALEPGTYFICQMILFNYLKVQLI